jgi:hypothetical protein
MLFFSSISYKEGIKIVKIYETSNYTIIYTLQFCNLPYYLLL